MVYGFVLALLVTSLGFLPVSVLPGPGWLHDVFIDQPLAQLVDAVRSLVGDGTVHVSGGAWVSLAWGLGLLLVLGALVLGQDRRSRVASSSAPRL